MDYLDYALRNKGARLSERMQQFEEVRAVSFTMAESESSNPPQELVKSMSERAIAPQQTTIPMQGDMDLAMNDSVQMPAAKPTIRQEEEVSTTITFANRSASPRIAADLIRKNIY